MRNRFNEPRRGRRPGRSGTVPTNSSPYDFGPADDEQVDPVDLLAIRADDELLDALAAGEFSLGDLGVGADDDLDGFQDDQRMMAMLAAWRDDVLETEVPELVTLEQASEAIVAGHRDTSYPRRRLMSVAAAAAVVVVGMSVVAIGAGTAEPGDALWGVSKTLDGDRAESKEAAQRVSVALASVQQALDEGRVKDAQATLAAVAPELAKVTDDETKDELARKQANLSESAEDAEEGEKVHTDESGKRDHKDKDKDARHSSSDNKSSDAKSSDAAAGKDPRGSHSSSSAADPRRAVAPSSSKPAPPPVTSTSDRPSPATSSKPEPSKTSSPPESKKPESSKPKDDSDKEKGKGEGESSSSSAHSTPTALPPPPGPPPPVPPAGG
jgi:hypothetical protein